MKAFLNNKIRKYYKYQEVTWTQPTLTSNGSFGGASMAVSRVDSGHSYNFGTAYESFSPNTGQNGFYCDEYTGWMYFVIYLPKPIKLANISFSIPNTGDGADGGAYNCHLWGGNSENDRREEIKDIGTVGQGSSYNSVLTSSNFYNYYTLYLENGGWSSEDKVTISNILFAGVERTVVDGTLEDYVFYKELCDVHVPYINIIYYAGKEN